jgi:prepilin-type N-terminal cleavage/methylation domain-containing protein
MNTKSKRAGFTMLETMITLVILCVVFASASYVESSATGLLSSSTSVDYMQEKASQALESIAADARWADGAAFLITPQYGSSRLDFPIATGYVGGVTTWSPAITYVVQPSSIDANGDGVINEGRLVRIQGGKTHLLCDYVVAGGFTAVRNGQNVVLQIRLALLDHATRRVMNVNERTSISLRN